MDNFKIPEKAMEEANLLFDKYDCNKNNLIELGELKSLLTDISKEIEITPPCDEDVDQLMHDIDIDKDNKISRTEFINLFKILLVMKNLNRQNI